MLMIGPTMLTSRPNCHLKIFCNFGTYTQQTQHGQNIMPPATTLAKQSEPYS